jgi:hypothetical protein
VEVRTGRIGTVGAESVRKGIQRGLMRALGRHPRRRAHETDYVTCSAAFE